MDVRLSPEQVALGDAVAQVVERTGPDAVGRLDDVERAARLDAAVVASGWRELRVAADDAGAPLASGVEVAIVAEGLGRGVADAAFVGPTLAADLRRRAGGAPATVAETVLLDARLGGVVVVEGPDASLPADARAIDAQGATRALALVAGADGLRLAGVPLGEPAPASDLTRREARPAADHVSLEADTGPLDRDDLTAWTALGLATTAADLVGTAAGAVHLATDYARQRAQYGRVIGSFQAVQHLLADAFVSTDGARSATLAAAWAVDALGPEDALFAASVAKAYGARAARSVGETAIQVHGGIGNTWECMAHVHLRRALLSSELLGGVGACLDRVLAHALGDADQPRGADRGLR